MGKKLRVREYTYHKNQNGFPCKKTLCDREICHSLANTEANIENIMLGVEVKLSAMPLGGRNRVL